MAGSASWLRALGRRSCVIAGAVAIAMLAACTTEKQAFRNGLAFTPPPPQTPAPHQLSQDEPEFLRMPNMASSRVPVRIGVILPLSSGNPGTRLLATSMLKAAQLALYDSNNHDIVLMTADDTGSAGDAAASARSLLAQGAEVIVGP